MRLINHSPRLKTDAPNHDDMNTPIKNINVIEVINPKPVNDLIFVKCRKYAFKKDKFM